MSPPADAGRGVVDPSTLTSWLAGSLNTPPGDSNRNTLTTLQGMGSVIPPDPPQTVSTVTSAQNSRLRNKPANNNASTGRSSRVVDV